MLITDNQSQLRDVSTVITTKEHLSNEVIFLINCCQSDPSSEEIEFIRTSSLTINHQLVIKLANQHGILPLVYKTLRKLSTLDHPPSGNTPGMQPLSLIHELKAHYQTIVQRNMLMSAELIRIIKLLEGNGIEAIAFKGPALSQMAYGDITLRQYVDLDVLVDEHHIFRAAELIVSSSYIPDRNINFFKNDKLLEVSSDLGLRNSRNHTYIELHWKLFRKKLSKTMVKLNIQSNSEIIEIKGKKIKTLRPDFLLVYLCSHGSKHMWERIEWITDIDRLIQNVESIDWKKVWEYAQQMHSIKTLLLGLSLSQELFGTVLPTFIQEKISNHKNIQSLKTNTLELLNNNTSTLTQNFEIRAMFKKFDYRSKLYDSSWDKTKFYFTIFFKVTPDDVLNIDLPKQLYFLYYIIRPFRLTYTRLNYRNK